MIREQRPNLSLALVGSLALHAGLAALAFVMWPKEVSDLVVSAVPVTIVSDAPATAPDIADEPPAAEPTPEPAAEAPPPPPEPAPREPTPAPPKKLTPQPAPKKAPTPPRTSREASFDPEAFSESFTPKTRRKSEPTPAPAPAKKTGGAPQRGPLSITGQVALDALTRRLTENWNLNCGSQGFALINPVVRFRLDDRGELVDGPRVVGGSSDPTWRAGAQRALNAVRAGEPYRDLPPELLNRNIEIAFKAEVACRG